MIDEKKFMEFMTVLEEAGAEYTTFDDLRKFIEEFPKMGEWIPMEEKLPPDGQKVLLSCNYMMFDYVTVGTIENGNRGKSYIADEDTFMRSAILAWQPLPNIYCK